MEAASDVRRRRESDEGGFQWGKALALAAGAGIGGLAKMPAEVRAKVVTGIVKDSLAGQTGISNFQTAATPNTPAVTTPAPRPALPIAAVNAVPPRPASTGVAPPAGQVAPRAPQGQQTPQLAQAAPATATDVPASDVNALAVNLRDEPFTCMGHAGTEPVTQGRCHDEQLAAKRVQCRADWLKHPATLRLYQCAAANSTGKFRAFYENEARGTQDMIRNYGAAQE